MSTATYRPRAQRLANHPPEILAEIDLEAGWSEIGDRLARRDELMEPSTFERVDQVVTALELGARLSATRYTYGTEGLVEVVAVVSWSDTEIGRFG